MSEEEEEEAGKTDANSAAPESEDQDCQEARLDWKDYVALFIAATETVAVPLVIMIGAFLVLVLLIGHPR